MTILERIKELSIDLTSETVANRRHLHANPELSFEEHNTSAFIKSRLQLWNIPYKDGLAQTGIQVLIKGRNPDKKVVALRGDMDALPIQEENDVPYKSQKPGIMHACGHDVHTASLLTSVNILNQLKDDFEGSVKFIFQPGEEKLPGGASLMIKEGVLSNPTPSHIFGQHVMPFIPAGKVGFRKGMYMASADEIYVTVKGKGGHGALPDHVIDPVVITAQIILSLQQVVSRMANPKIPSVLSFGKVIANGATNVIPDQVNIEGTFRTLDENWRYQAHAKMKKMAEGIAESMGGSCDFDIRVGYPFLRNEPDTTERARNAASQYLGENNIEDLDIWMAAEDFAFYSQETAACFYRLGTRNESKNITSGVHTPTFDIDEDVLSFSPGLMAWIALNELNS